MNKSRTTEDWKEKWKERAKAAVPGTFSQFVWSEHNNDTKKQVMNRWRQKKKKECRLITLVGIGIQRYVPPRKMKVDAPSTGKSRNWKFQTAKINLNISDLT